MGIVWCAGLCARAWYVIMDTILQVNYNSSNNNNNRSYKKALQLSLPVGLEALKYLRCKFNKE
jgi:hypothetical protein